MSADNKLRAVVVLRLDDGGSTTIVAKLDYAQHDSSSSTTSDDLYGNENDFAKAVQNAVSNDSPTAGLSGKIGGFKVVQSEMHQVTYGADTLGLCKLFAFIPLATWDDARS